MPLFFDAVTIFLGIVVEALPFVLIGVFASAVVKHYVSQERLLRLIPSNRLGGLLVGSGIGFVFPVCECGNIPLARRLLLKGVSPSVVVTFLLAAPVLNPVVILATYAAFRTQPEIVWLRILFTFVVALTIGFVFSLNKKPEDILRADVAAERDGHGHHDGEGPRWRAFIGTMVGEFYEMSTVLAFGAFVASFSQIIFPREMITGLGTGALSSTLSMMGLAAAVSICSNVDAFFALSYTNLFTTGSILAFLVFGPMIDIKAIAMLRTTFKTGAIVVMTALAFQLTLLLALLYNFWVS
jgi:uncharacterized membrane protein YraQ (UPF0718 family)